MGVRGCSLMCLSKEKRVIDRFRMVLERLVRGGDRVWSIDRVHWQGLSNELIGRIDRVCQMY